MIIGDFIERNARFSGDNPALCFEGRSISHRQFADRVRRLVNALASRGNARQARVAVLSRNCPEYLEVYGAAGLGGYVGLGLNYRLSAPEQTTILQDAEPAVLMFEREYLGRVNELRGALPPGVLFVCFDPLRRPMAPGLSATPRCSPKLAPSRWRSVRQPDDTFLLIYTSGTTA
jgi:acyl-CoA synthetase (AMP-forming)/AMP-acid ligase II